MSRLIEIPLHVAVIILCHLPKHTAQLGKFATGHYYFRKIYCAKPINGFVSEI
jgi:hypothetical protein